MERMAAPELLRLAGGRTLDLDGWQVVTGDGERLLLNRSERVLLGALAARPGRVVDAEALYRAVTGQQPLYGPYTARIVRAAVFRVRRKVGPAAIENRRGGGWRLAVVVEGA